MTLEDFFSRFVDLYLKESLFVLVVLHEPQCRNVNNLFGNKMFFPAKVIYVFHLIGVSSVLSILFYQYSKLFGLRPSSYKPNDFHTKLMKQQQEERQCMQENKLSN